jgi:hypothetical protein
MYNNKYFALSFRIRLLIFYLIGVPTPVRVGILEARLIEFNLKNVTA